MLMGFCRWPSTCVCMCVEATDCHHVSLPAIFQYLAGPGVPHLGWTSWSASFRVPAAADNKCWVAQTRNQGPSCPPCSAATLMESHMCLLRQGVSNCSTSCSFSLTNSQQLQETEESLLKKFLTFESFGFFFLPLFFTLIHPN